MDESAEESLHEGLGSPEEKEKSERKAAGKEQVRAYLAPSQVYLSSP